MVKILTKRKQKWVERFQPDVLRGTPLMPNAGTALRYYDKLEAIIRRMSRETKAEIEAFFREPHAKEFFAEDASVASQAHILTNALIKKFDKLFDLRAKPLAEQMAANVDRDSSASLHTSLKDLSGGLSLKTTVMPRDLSEALNASIIENVSLIKSIASQYQDGIQQAMMRSITTGNGLQDMIPFLQRHEGVTLRRARLIANDQSRKAFSAISRQRMQKLGLKQFRWLHSSAPEEPRKLHLELNGGIFDFDDPPVIDKKTGERGFPGQLINCKCVMQSVITFAGE